GRILDQQGRGPSHGRHQPDRRHRWHALARRTGEKLVPDRCDRIENDALGHLGAAGSRALPIHHRSDVVSSSAPDAPQLFDDPELNQLFTDTMAVVISELRAEWKQDIQRLERDSKIAKLEGKVETL